MGVTEKSDQQLIESIKGGQKEEYRIIVDRYKHYAYTIALKLVKNSVDAEEVSQEAFIKAYKKLDSFRGEASFSTWLYRIVFNTAVTYRRKSARNVSMEEIKIIKTVQDPKPAEDYDRKRFIKKAMDRLIPVDATILTLFYLKDKSLEEIMDITGMHLNTVKVRLFRARKRMAQELENILANEAKTLY